MEPQSVSEGREAMYLVRLDLPSANLPDQRSADFVSIGEVSQIVILRCAFRAMEVREAEPNVSMAIGQTTRK